MYCKYTNKILNLLSKIICFIKRLLNAMVNKKKFSFSCTRSFTHGYFGRINIYALSLLSVKRKGGKEWNISFFSFQVFIYRNCTDAGENTTVVKITYKLLWPSSIKYMYLTELQQFLVCETRIFREIRYRLSKEYQLRLPVWFLKHS